MQAVLHNFHFSPFDLDFTVVLESNKTMSKRAAKLAGVAPSLKNKLPPSPAKPRESTSPPPSKRARAAASPSPQAKKGLRKASAVSDAYTSTGIAFEMAAEPTVDAGPLPPAHQAMLDRWLALETALVFFGRRGEPAVLGKLKLAVENSAGRSLHPRHLGQMLTLWPGCYVVRGYSALGRHRDFSGRAPAHGGSHESTMPPPPSKSLAHFDLSVELGPDEDSGAAAVAPEDTGASTAEPAVSGSPAPSGSSPVKGSMAAESSYATLMSRRRIAFSEARLLARRDKIVNILRAHAAAAHLKSTSAPPEASSSSSANSTANSEPTGDPINTTSTATAAEAEMLANNGNLAAAASAFGALELNVPAAPLPGLHNMSSSASSASSKPSAKPALPTARSQLGAPATVASPSVPAPETGDGDATTTSATAAADQPTTTTTGASSAATTQAALRARVAQREQSKALVEDAAGGKAGRRKQRLLASLPSFCDALHSFLVQRRVATVPRPELVHHLTARLPWRPRPPPDQV